MTATGQPFAPNLPRQAFEHHVEHCQRCFSASMREAMCKEGLELWDAYRNFMLRPRDLSEEG